jgi:hypothetical protein
VRAVMQKNRLQIVNTLNTESMLAYQLLPQSQQFYLLLIVTPQSQLIHIHIEMSMQFGLRLGRSTIRRDILRQMYRFVLSERLPVSEMEFGHIIACDKIIASDFIIH